MVLCAGSGKLFLLPILILFTICARGNDFFTKIYNQINSNIENGNFKANHALVETLESDDEFKTLDCYLQGKIYHKLGVSLYLAYQEKNAITYFEKVLKLWENCPQVPEIEKGNTKYNLGLSQQYLGNYVQAKTYLDEALTAFEKAKDYSPYELGLKYHGIGLFYESIDDLFRSQLYFSNAINLFEKENAIDEQFEVLNSAVTLYMDFKEYDKASDYVAMAMELAEANPDKIAFHELTPVYLNAATIAFEQKKTSMAQTLAETALKITDRIQSPMYYTIGLEILAFVQMEHNAFEKADQYMRQVLAIRSQLNKDGSGLNLMALTHENFAELYMRQGDFEKADEQLTKGFRIVIPDAELDGQQVPNIRKTNAVDDNLLIRLMEMKSKILDSKYEKTGEVAWLQHSLNVQHKIDSIIKRGLFSFRFEQSKLDFIGIRFKYYGKAIKDALRLYALTDDTYYLEEAYQFSAKTKALILQQELNRINALRSTVSNSALEEEKRLWQLMSEQQSLVFEATKEEKDSLLPSFLKAQNAWESYLKEVEKNQPDYYRKRFEFLQLPTISTLQNSLPDDLAVIEFFEAQDAIHSFWISSDQFFSLTVALDVPLKESISRFTEQCRDPQLSISQIDSQHIFTQLLQGGLARLKKVGRLSIIPDGSLHNLSFEALKNGPKFLIEDYSFNYAYATGLIGGQEQHVTKTVNKYVGFAASYSSDLNTKLLERKRLFGEQALTQLTLSKNEVREASKIFNGKIFVDEEATLANFYGNVDNAGIVHLSLHGLVDTDDPTRSCIVFDDSTPDFLLSPPDLYKNTLVADLVLLSACHSASGKIYSGEGVQGMTKAFLLAGAQNVLSSLWNASESSSLDIILSFLENSEKGLPFDSALRLAKLDYLKEATPSQQHPYYWSNYILLGKVEPAPPFCWKIILLPIVGVLAFAIAFFMYSRRHTKPISGSVAKKRP